jgi:hypothetical protein
LAIARAVSAADFEHCGSEAEARCAMKRFSEAAMNVLISAACVSMIAMSVRTWSAPARSAEPSRPFTKGERIEGLQIDTSDAPRTAIVFLHSSCRYCAASMGFYKTLVTSEAHRRGKFQFVVAGMEDEATLTKFVNDFQLTPDKIVSVPRIDPRVRATPTLLVVDRRGVVQQSWVGQQPQNGERDIVNEVSSS